MSQLSIVSIKTRLQSNSLEISSPLVDLIETVISLKQNTQGQDTSCDQEREIGLNLNVL